MNIVEAQFEPFCIMTRERASDGEGGFTPTSVWKEGAEFQATTRLDNSMLAKIAQSEGVTAVYTIITKKSVELEFNDVIKRVKDGITYKITGEATSTPNISALNLKAVSAERWKLPND